MILGLPDGQQWLELFMLLLYRKSFSQESFSGFQRYDSECENAMRSCQNCDIENKRSTSSERRACLGSCGAGDEFAFSLYLAWCTEAQPLVVPNSAKRVFKKTVNARALHEY